MVQVAKLEIEVEIGANVSEHQMTLKVDGVPFEKMLMGPKEYFGTLRSTHKHHFSGFLKESFFNLVKAVKGMSKEVVLIRVAYNSKRKTAYLNVVDTK